MFGRRLLEDDLETLGMNSEDGQKIGEKHGREGFNSGQEGFLQAKGYTEEEVKKLYSCVTVGIPGVKAVESTLTRSSSVSAHLGVAHEDIIPDALQDPGSKLIMHLHLVHDEARREVEQAAALQKQYLAQVEAEILNSVGMLQHVFSRSDFGAINADGTPVDHLGHHVTANLGFVMGDAQETFRRALEKMNKVKFGVGVRWLLCPRRRRAEQGLRRGPYAACDDVHGLGLPPGGQRPLPAQKRRVFPPWRVHAETSFGSEFGDDHEFGC